MESTTAKKAQRSNCLSQWWNQKYPHQKRLELVFEHPLFHLLIIIFVVVSFTIDIYLLIVDKESIIAHSAILIVILRLWHLLQIAND
jgi:hypothetical protein